MNKKDRNIWGFLTTELEPCEGDKEDWEEILGDTDGLKDLETGTGTICWYPASAQDWTLLTACDLLANSIQGHIPPDLFIYTDYEPRVYRQLLDIYYGFDDKEHRVKVGPLQFRDGWDRHSHSAEKKELEITCMIKLRLQSPELQKAMCQTNVRAGSDAGIQRNWIYLELAADDDFYPILFTPEEHLSLFKNVMEPYRIRPTYLCAVSDGCRKGGAWVCCNDPANVFFKTVTSSEECSPIYWLTDHWKCHAPGFRQLGTFPRGHFHFENNRWGRYGDRVGMYKVGKPPLSLGETRTMSMGPLTLVCRFDDILRDVINYPARIIPHYPDAEIAFEDSAHGDRPVFLLGKEHSCAADDSFKLRDLLIPYLEQLLTKDIRHLAVFALGSEHLRYSAHTFQPLVEWLSGKHETFTLEFCLLHNDDFTGSIWDDRRE